MTTAAAAAAARTGCRILSENGSSRKRKFSSLMRSLEQNVPYGVLRLWSFREHHGGEEGFSYSRPYFPGPTRGSLGTALLVRQQPTSFDCRFVFFSRLALRWQCFSLGGLIFSRASSITYVARLWHHFSCFYYDNDWGKLAILDGSKIEIGIGV